MPHYKATRPKGYAEWKPQAATMEVLSQVEEVLETYREHWPLTIRQVFYRLVGVHGYDKTDLAYERLCNYLNRGRRANLIPFSAIRDDGLLRIDPNCYAEPGQFLDTVIAAATRFTRDKQEYQPNKLFVLCEAGGMVPQLVKVADPYSVPVLSSGGFDSLTIKYELAMEAKNEDRPVIFLHIGDYDPSGVCIFDALAADIKAFAKGAAEFVRIALLPEQIKHYNLPTAPPKKTDRRNNGVTETCQAEALPPDELACIVDTAIQQYYDIAQLEQDRKQEPKDRARLVSVLRGAI